MLKIFVLVIYFITLIKGKDLPTYIKKCKPSDVNLKDCITAHANDAIPSIVKGDADFKLINMSPLVIPEVNLGTGPNLEMRLKQVTTDSLKDVKITNSNPDVKSNKLSLEATLDVLEVISNYFIKGQILVLPINGEGESNITSISNKLTYDIQFGIKTLGNEKFYTIEKATLKIEPQRVYFYFKNLFGGDPNLGKQMNDFLNKNWKEFFDELQPAIEKAIETVVTNVFKVYFSQVPISKIFDN